MNKLIFTGNLGQDAQYRSTSTGTSLLKFSVACKSGYGENQKTTWINCDLWGKRADSMAQYLVKGQAVLVAGEFSMDSWTDKTGVEKASPALRVEDLDLIGAKKAEQQNHYPAATPAPAQINPFNQQPQFNQPVDEGTNGYQQSTGTNYRNRPSGKSSVYENQKAAEQEQRMRDAIAQDINNLDDIPF